MSESRRGSHQGGLYCHHQRALARPALTLRASDRREIELPGILDTLDTPGIAHGFAASFTPSVRKYAYRSARSPGFRSFNRPAGISEVGTGRFDSMSFASNRRV